MSSRKMLTVAVVAVSAGSALCGVEGARPHLGLLAKSRYEVLAKYEAGGAGSGSASEARNPPEDIEDNLSNTTVEAESVEELSQKLGELQEVHASTANHLRELREERRTELASLDAKEKQIQAQNQQIQKLTAEVGIVGKRESATRRQMTAEKEQQNKKMDALQKKNEGLEQRIQKLTQTVRTTAKKEKQALKKSTILQNGKQEHAAEMAALRQELSALKQEKEQGQIEMDSLREANNRLGVLVFNWQNELKEKKTIEERSQQQMQKIVELSQARSAEISVLTKEIGEQEQEIVQLRRKNNLLEKTVSNNAGLETQLTNLHNAFDQRQESARKLVQNQTSRISALEKEQEAAILVFEQLSEQLNEKEKALQAAFTILRDVQPELVPEAWQSQSESSPTMFEANY